MSAVSLINQLKHSPKRLSLLLSYTRPRLLSLSLSEGVPFPPAQNNSVLPAFKTQGTFSSLDCILRGQATLSRNTATPHRCGNVAPTPKEFTAKQ
ncbi:hypothetical protein TNCV_954201 [Trichonephila clavipes]|nr:hypothetical protein TNCV_954201 [Trichonephila clavipes]